MIPGGTMDISSSAYCSFAEGVFGEGVVVQAERPRRAANRISGQSFIGLSLIVWQVSGFRRA
jgi:hypothetical protein